MRALDEDLGIKYDGSDADLGRAVEFYYQESAWDLAVWLYEARCRVVELEIAALSAQRDMLNGNG